MFLKKTIASIAAQKQKFFFVLLIISIILFALPHETHLLVCTGEHYPISPRSDTITIWIHGTLFSQKLLQKAYQLIQTPLYIIFGTYLPSLHIPPGLHKVNELNERSYARSTLLTLHNAYQDAPTDHYYAFGWSGKLSVTDRKKAGANLYQKLVLLQKEYIRTHGITPSFRIITHSHGGAVALYLAQEVKPEDNLLIHELILLACPVQKQTAHLIGHPMFQRIYSLYSDRDILQWLDPQKLQTTDVRQTPFFSERYFPHHNNLRQVEIIIDGKHLWHIDFMLTLFLKKLPFIIDHIDQWFLQKPLQTYIKRVLRLYTRHHLLKRHTRRLQRKGIDYVISC